MAALGNQVYTFGGLTATQASAATVTRISAAGVSSLAPLPTPLHDASATALGGRLYVLGGGQSVSYSGIGRYDPGTGGTTLIGALPTPLSDLSTATIGSTTYVVGGFTGTVFSDRILAYTRRAVGTGRRPSARWTAVCRGRGRRGQARDRRRPHAGGRHRRRAELRPGDRSHDPDRPPAPTAHARLGRSDRRDGVRRRRADLGGHTHQLGARDRSRGARAPRAPSRPAALGRRGRHDADRTGGGRRMGRAGAGGQRVAPAHEHVQTTAATATGLGAPASPRCSGGRFREIC